MGVVHGRCFQNHPGGHDRLPRRELRHQRPGQLGTVQPQHQPANGRTLGRRGCGLTLGLVRTLLPAAGAIHDGGRHPPDRWQLYRLLRCSRPAVHNGGGGCGIHLPGGSATLPQRDHCRHRPRGQASHVGQCAPHFIHGLLSRLWIGAK